MDSSEFRKIAHETVDFIADYFDNLESLRVTPETKPGEIIAQLPMAPPLSGESFGDIMEDFKNIIMPGITHWQHPNFHGYFPANNSYPSIIGEMLTSAIGAQCMVWKTSPAAAELEEVVMNWLAEMTGLPKSFHGVIQDTASTATLCSILTAREKKSEFSINSSGFDQNQKFTVYCSSEAHSSVEKAVKIAGIGKNNLRKIPVDDKFAMRVDKLRETIQNDIDSGFVPLCVVAALGTTGSTAVDPIAEIGEICQKHNIWLHVDGALAGTAMLLEEKRHLMKGIELADTFVFNPHKWMLTNFDCSAYFVKDKEALIKTFEIMPEYLKTAEDKEVNNYRDWGIQLGRRFRALKLWFVIRSYGAEGLRAVIREHIRLTNELLEEISGKEYIEILAPVDFNTICFRFKPAGYSEEELNTLNEKILKSANDTGKIFITHTKLNGKYTIRIVIAQTNVAKRNVDEAWEVIERSYLNCLGGN